MIINIALIILISILAGINFWYLNKTLPKNKPEIKKIKKESINNSASNIWEDEDDETM